MSFAWTKQVRQLQYQPQIQTQQHPTTSEDVQEVVLPTFNDKISVLEHKNGKRLVSTRQEDNEGNEVKGDLQKG